MPSLSKFDLCVIGGACVGCAALGCLGTYVFITRGLGETAGQRGQSAQSANDETDGVVTNREETCRPIQETPTVNGQGNERERQELQKRQIHDQLAIFLNDEIGNDEDCRFSEMQLVSKKYIGHAKSYACKDFLHLWTALERGERGKRIDVGNYDLVTSIFEQSGYGNEEVINKIHLAEKSIQSLDFIDEVDTCSIPADTDSVRPFKYDGIILYANTDASRQVAIQFREDVKNIVTDLELILHEEFGGGGIQALQEGELFVQDCMFIYILVTADLTEDNLKMFIANAILLDLIRKNQWRVVPVLTTSHPQVKAPGALGCLVGQSYYFYIEQAYANCKDIFAYSFKNSIASGRGKAYNM